MFLSTDKILAKKYLRAAGLLTPPWVTLEEATLGLPLSPPYIVKSIQEDASIGLDDLSVVSKDTPAAVEIRQRAERFGGDGLPKPSIDGREFNLSILEGKAARNFSPQPKFSSLITRKASLRLLGIQRNGRRVPSNTRTPPELLPFHKMIVAYLTACLPRH